MSVLERISFFQNRRDDVPNQELARSLAAARDQAGIAEMAANLTHPNPNVRSDCLKVLYETGYLAPELIAPHVQDFLALLSSRQNRMVWGALIALGTIAPLCPDEICARAPLLIHAVDEGTVISQLWGIRALARAAANRPACRARVLPHLLGWLERCIPRDVPTHAESMLPAVDAESKPAFLAVLEHRQPELSHAQVSRLKKVLRQL